VRSVWGELSSVLSMWFGLLRGNRAKMRPRSSTLTAQESIRIAVVPLQSTLAWKA
jgi:hypothetical protein